MTKLLQIDSSPLGANSVSRQLTAQIVATWVAAKPDTVVEPVSYTHLTLPTKRIV